jgi:Ca2+/Na+ antiporter
MAIILIGAIFGILLAVLAWQRAGYVAAAYTLTALSICSYAGYTLHLGIFLGDYPAWYFEGKFLVIGFSLSAIIGSAFALVAVAFSLISLMKNIKVGERIRWSHLAVLGAASTATVMCSYECKK